MERTYLIYTEHEGENYRVVVDFSLEQFLELKRTGRFSLDVDSTMARTVRPITAILVGEIWEHNMPIEEVQTLNELRRSLQRQFEGDGTGRISGTSMASAARTSV